MAGIYIHLPFCKDKCYYCDFFSGNQLYLIDHYVIAVVGEIELRKSYVNDNQIDTIYFGGGTPSLLSSFQLGRIINKIQTSFHISPSAEITIECNPENISKEYLKDLYDIGFNRISLGVQFLKDAVLSKYNRKHSKELIISSLDRICDSQLRNLSLDLIYSVPEISDSYVEQSLMELLKYDIKHFSAYELTISRHSKLYWQKVENSVDSQSEESSIRQYRLIRDILRVHGFVQYEVSNYALPGFYSRHNLGYWNLELYLGIGTSAHSYNGISRQWNHKNIKKYLDEIERGIVSFDYEILSEEQKYNEYIMLKLRTCEGLSKNFILESFNKSISNHFLSVLQKLVSQGSFELVKDRVIPKEDDILLADFLSKMLYYNS